MNMQERVASSFLSKRKTAGMGMEFLTKPIDYVKSVERNLGKWVKKHTDGEATYVKGTLKWGKFEADPYTNSGTYHFQYEVDTDEGKGTYYAKVSARLDGHKAYIAVMFY